MAPPQSPALCRPLNAGLKVSPLKVNFRRAMATEANGEYDLVVIGGGMYPAATLILAL